MKVLVTGSNGLLGHQVVMELLRREHIVKIIVRSTRKLFFDLSEVEVFEGNFCNYKNLRIAAFGCDAIIHIAAVTSTNFLYYSDYSTINIDGTALVLKVAKELNIKRFVYVSTANTIGYGSEQQLADECFNIEFPFTKSFYAQSKMVAEKLVIEASKETNNHFVIVNPTFMIGAYDPKPSSGKLMLMGYKRKLLFVPKGGKNFVPVVDVALTVCNALNEGKNGERYLACGVNLSFSEFYQLQRKIGAYSQRIITIPDVLLEIAGKAGDLLRLFGIKTEVCTMNLMQLMVREYYTNKKAKKELHLQESDLKIAIKEAIDWFNENGMT